MHPSRQILRTEASPVVEAKGWIKDRRFPPDRPLIDVSQAAPADPPPETMRLAMADMVVNQPAAHLYGPVLGLPDLREALARQMNSIYGSEVSSAQIAITQGCNQAFTVVLQALAEAGDEVILPVPWYFNHKMWLDMTGVTSVPLSVGPDMIPDAEDAKKLITSKTRAIVLISPNNPAGVEYPNTTLHAFLNLAREAGIALILDETYRDFHSANDAPHSLFQDPDWDDTLVHLYSFSKAYRLTGHRVGAIAANTTLLQQAEKVLDTVAICASQLGQRAALWGIENLGQWLTGERSEILARRRAAEDCLGTLEGWALKSVGAYFAWLEHPFDAGSDVVARALVDKAHVLSLPGTAFASAGDPAGGKGLRIAFPNVDATGLSALRDRLLPLSHLPLS